MTRYVADVRWFLVLMVALFALTVAAGCTITSTDSDKAGLTCVEGHDEIVDGEGSGKGDHAIFVCTKYEPEKG